MVSEENKTETFRCPVCDYNLTGLRDNRCPECGTQFNREELSQEPPPFWPRPSRLLLQGPLIWSLVPVWLVVSESNFGRDLVSPALQMLVVALLFFAGLLWAGVIAVQMGAAAGNEGGGQTFKSGNFVKMTALAMLCQGAMAVIGFVLTTFLVLSLGGRFPLR